MECGEAVHLMENFQTMMIVHVAGWFTPDFSNYQVSRFA